MSLLGVSPVMAHVPHYPQLYVCEACNAVYAGIEIEDDPARQYRPPDDCAACGATEFVRIETLDE